MGILDDFKASFGEDALAPAGNRSGDSNWHELCTCGHLDRFHPDTIGGTIPVADPVEKTWPGGEEGAVVTVLNGCVGALPPRGFEYETVTFNREVFTQTITRHPTCPCTEFRGVARVDRPNRYFCQRMPKDREDQLRHPFQAGIRAFSTHLGKRKAAQSNPDWATAEFDRRFTWLPDARVCSLSKCNATADVWPVFVDADDRSELRCPKHR